MMLCRMNCLCFVFFFFFKQKTAYEMRISDWSSDVCSSDLMANTKSAKKAVRQTAGRTERNRARISRVRGFVRKVEEAIASGDKASAEEIGRASCRERVCQYV